MMAVANAGRGVREDQAAGQDVKVRVQVETEALMDPMASTGRRPTMRPSLLEGGRAVSLLHYARCSAIISSHLAKEDKALLLRIRARAGEELGACFLTIRVRPLAMGRMGPLVAADMVQVEVERELHNITMITPNIFTIMQVEMVPADLFTLSGDSK